MRYSILFVIYLFACSSSGWAIVKINSYTPTISNADYLQYVRYLTVPIGSQSGTTWDAGNNTTGLTDAQIQAIVTAIVGLEAPLNQEIYNKMQSSTTETFSFSDVNQAKTVVQHRIQTIAIMQNFNLHGQFQYVGNGHPPTSYVSDWQTGSPTKFYFRQSGGTPDQAINQLCTAPTGATPNVYGECLGAIETCIWWGADQAYGATAFNTEFGSSPLDMDARHGSPPSCRHHLAAAVDSSVIIPGDWVYFQNDNYSQVIHDPYLATGVLKGAVLLWSGENALYIGSGSYEGLGAGGPGVNLRDAEMNAYNSDLDPVRAKYGKYLQWHEYLPDDEWRCNYQNSDKPYSTDCALTALQFMKILSLSVLSLIIVSVGLLADDGGGDIPSNAKKVGPITMREPGRTCYNYLIPGKSFTEDILVAKEIYEGNQIVERDLYRGELDRNGFPKSTLNGIQRKWYPNGQLASEEPYEDGRMNGTFKQWNKRGQLVAQYEMANGTGVKRVYIDSGELILDENYHKGMLEGETMSVTGPENVMDISSFKEGASSGISVGFYKDGTIRSISWGGGPLIEFSKSGAAFDKVWQINGQRMSEKDYAEKVGGSSDLPPYFSDPNRYKQVVPQAIFDALNKYRAMPRVKIPLEFDKDGKPVPAS